MLTLNFFSLFHLFFFFRLGLNFFTLCIKTFIDIITFITYFLLTTSTSNLLIFLFSDCFLRLSEIFRFFFLGQNFSINPHFFSYLSPLSILTFFTFYTFHFFDELEPFLSDFFFFSFRIVL